MDYNGIKSHFQIKQDHGDMCKAMCPSHQDKEASLSIKYDRTAGKTILKCHAGCEIENVVSAAGIKISDLFDEKFKSDLKNSDSNISAVYKYRDATSKVLFEKVRFEKPKKHFTQRRIIDGATVWGLDGGAYYETFNNSNNWSKKQRDTNTREFEDCKPVIYNLPEVLEAIKQGKEVFIAEGEKDADNLKRLGFTATCNFDGASASKQKPKWKEEYNSYFKGAKVIIFNDNDDAGKSHADYIASQLSQISEYVKRPIISGLAEKEDISDWINRGANKEDIEKLVQETSIWDKSLLPKEVDLINFNFSDVGNAERLLAMYGENIKYNPIRNKWLVWTGKYWEYDISGKIEILARNCIKELQAQGVSLPKQIGDIDNSKLKEQINKFVLRSESDGRVKAMINQCKTQEKLVIKETDKDAYLLNVKNGTLDLKTGKLKKHNKNDFITKSVDVRFDAGAKCPNWIEFLNKIFLGNQELIDYIQKSIGYSLTGDANLQCFYVLHGQGSNGKGTFMKVLSNILGGYYATLKSNSLMERNNDEGARGDLAKLAGKRFACVNELEDGKSFDESLLKAITSGADEPIPVRRMYEEEFDLYPMFKIWMTTNKLPKIKGTDNGIWRRVRKIPFEYSFENDENKDLYFYENKLFPELSGILNWAIEGCLKWQSEGVEVPEIVKCAVEEYRSDMDTIQRFIDECCIVSETCRSIITQLYNIYEEWCKENKEYTLSSIKFSKKMKEKGFEQERKEKYRYWVKIGILDDEHLNFNNNSTVKNDNFQMGIKEIKNNIYPFNDK
jgi:putative DNA primase/helicase